MCVRLLSLGLLAAVLALVGGAPGAQSQAPPISKTYIFTQAICLPPPAPPPGSPPLTAAPPGTCTPQTVPVGAAVQVQLPGTPSQWSVARLSNIEGGAWKVIPDPLRIAGTSEIYIFSFTATQAGPATITLRESPPFIAWQSDGMFHYTLTVRR